MKGVSVSFHSPFTPEVLDTEIDPKGRFLFLKLKYLQTVFTIANVYLPNQDQLHFLSSLTARLNIYHEQMGNFEMRVARDFHSTRLQTEKGPHRGHILPLLSGRFPRNHTRTHLRSQNTSGTLQYKAGPTASFCRKVFDSL